MLKGGVLSQSNRFAGKVVGNSVVKNSPPAPVPLTAARQSAMLLSRGTRKEVEG